MFSFGISDEGLSHLLDQIFSEEELPVQTTPVEIQRDMVVTPRFKTKQKVTDKPPKLLSSKDYHQKMTPTNMEKTYSHMTRTKLR